MTSETMIFLSALAALVPLSYLVEAFRTAPAVPDRLDWAPDIPIRYVEVKGTKLRYVAAGRGPALVLLHTLRTQLDMFQKVIPELAQRFRVYALDYPGHGYSDIPKAEYSSELFVTAAAQFLDQLDIRDAVIVGESIGGTIGLLLAARHNARVRAGGPPDIADLRRPRLVSCGRERVGPPGDSGRRAANYQGRRAFPLARCTRGGHASRGWIREPSKGVLMPPTPPTPINGKICYIEMPALDIRRSADFYAKVFGWKIRKRGDGATAFDDATGQVSATWVLGRPAASQLGLLVYIMVDSVAATIEDIADD